MRLHTVEITAFGPFTETVRVDFDRLSDAGLFLFTGPTGAGKTSVLDAVCFALYGDVPGDRAMAKRLRSDHAAPGAAPRVELETTVAGRRFRITRSPSWERPKKRGSGTTTQQASVVLAERVDGEWSTLSTRLDEAGHQVTELLGMTLSQFTQVAMLPQGRFQAFLRAKSEERQELLQRLFRTRRYAEVEHWLREHRLDLRHRSDSAHKTLADVVSRVSETAGADLPGAWDPADLAAPAEDGSLEVWSAETLRAADAAAQSAERDRVEAAEHEVATRQRLDAARQLATRRARVLRAQDDHERLGAHTSEMAQIRTRLAAAHRAATVLPLARVAEQARRAHRDATAAVRQTISRAELRTAIDELNERLTTVRGLLPREQELDGTRAELTTIADRLTGAEQARATARAECERLPGAVAALRQELEAGHEADGKVEATAARLDSLVMADELGPRVEALHAEHQAARERVLTARERLIDVRQERLNHMAAELAGGLAVGADCPVCGSAEHPAKAAPVEGAADAAAERAAQHEVDDANSAEHVLGLTLGEQTTRLRIAREQATGHTRESLTATLRELRSAAARLPQLRADLAAAEQRESDQRALLNDLSVEVAKLHEQSRAVTAQRDRLEAVVSAMLEETEHDTLGGLAEALGAEVRQRQDDLAALEQAERTRAALASATATVEEASASAGFDSVDDAVRQALPAGTVEELEQRLRAHDRDLAVTEAVLAEPDADELLAAEVPSLDDLGEAHRAALAGANDSAAAARGTSRRAGRLRALHGDLAGELGSWAPLQRELRLAESVSQFVEGKHPDNRLKMRLAAYVVAYRLTQVVAAANERLARMSDQRYSLEHSAERGARDTRGGLSLLIRDDWSGESRDPATLSGGETFVVSLALALGLADVITQEAGGAELDTLFVDEGFGSLDADTLDDVMDTLDALRDGGRVVGVVSHVAEMRDRIPAQLVVSKARAGSTVQVRAD
ncbi:AAA family ATPase [Nocardioides insulae]|uniref:AAA family ATPase n=1 Tax=Nocardioides insulae TaxID=394734 RepID=UPI0003FF0151|nr:SMC family ATPase [Nocardioides insulae]